MLATGPGMKIHEELEAVWQPTKAPRLLLSMSYGKGTVDWSKLNCVGNTAWAHQTSIAVAIGAWKV